MSLPINMRIKIKKLFYFKMMRKNQKNINQKQSFLFKKIKIKILLIQIVTFQNQFID